MSSLTFITYDSVQSIADGVPQTITGLNISNANVRTPIVNRKDTFSLEGTTGVTRIRSTRYENSITVPYIANAQLPIWIDLSRSAARGFESPLVINLSDVPGNIDNISAILTDPQLLIDILNCAASSTQINYREIVNG